MKRRVRPAPALAGGVLGLLFALAGSAVPRTAAPPAAPTVHGASGVPAAPPAQPTTGPIEPPLTTKVNFESPPVKALALSEDGLTLFAANTPAHRLAVIDASAGLSLAAEIPVGVEPVAVAVQPGTGSSLVWVANMVSDNVAVVDVNEGRVVAVVPVPDEPVNVLFDDAGTHALVVSQAGFLTSIDTATRAVVDSLPLACNTPRAAAYAGGLVYVAALHSGNNTTSVGRTVEMHFDNGEEVVAPMLRIAQTLEATRDLFEHPLLSPWPDPPTLVTEPSPLVARILPDFGVTVGNPWVDILAAIDDGTGSPRAEVVAQLEALMTDALGWTLTNAEDVLQLMLDERTDTVDHDLIVVDAASPASLAMVAELGGVGTTLTGLGRNPVTGELFVSNLEPRNLVRLVPNLRGHFVDHQVAIVRDVVGPLVETTDLHADVPNFNDVSAPNLPAQQASLANPTDVVFRADGGRAYVAALGPDRVGVLDGADATVLGRVDVPGGPRSLALDDRRELLFVLSRTDLAVTAVDVSTDSPSVLATLPLDPREPAAIAQGRQFLYSTRHSNNFASSCAMCHIDADNDYLVWDLSDPGADLQPVPIPHKGPPFEVQNHPVKGPLLTKSLKGLRDHRPFHWRGDRPALEDFNSNYEELLGGALLGDAALAKLVRFLRSLTYPPNPYRAPDNSYLDPRAYDGEAVFMERTLPTVEACGECHQLAVDGAKKRPPFSEDVAMGFGRRFGQIQMIPHLRGVYKIAQRDLYNGFGAIHDGRLKRYEEADDLLTAFLKELNPQIVDPERSALVAYTLAINSNVRPIVGWQVLVEPPVTPGDLADLQLLLDEFAATPSHCDVVAHGVLQGAGRRLLLLGFHPDTGAPTFRADDGSLRTLGELLDQVDAGAPFLFTGLPPGSGDRYLQ